MVSEIDWKLAKKDHAPAQHRHPVAEQAQGQQRLRAAALMNDEQRQAQPGAGEQGHYCRVNPGVALADQGDAQ